MFWLYFFVLNSLFFLPRYLMEANTSSFFPYKGLLEGPLKERIRFLINRYNYDIFRVSADFFFVALLFLLFKTALPPGLWLGLIFVFFILIFVYHFYYQVFESIYQLEPTFYSNALMLKTGFQIFFRKFGWVNFFILSSVLLVFVAIFFLLKQLVMVGYQFQPGPFSYTLIIAFSLLSLYSLVNYKYRSYGKIVFPSQVQSIFRNIKQSLITKANLENIDFEKLVQARPYGQLQLQERPNIYFLVVESYGRLVYDHPKLFPDYEAYMQGFEQELAASKWFSTSHLSQAPITGGASWISYTSALMGFKIKEQGTYLSLMYREEMQRYEHLIRWLQNQGYKSYRLVPIPSFKGMKIPWDQYQSFYAIDEWIRPKEMQFKGKCYGFGPCPPDQYSLNFAHEWIKKKEQHPFFLFFITQNSHSPFLSPEKVVPNWRDLYDASVPPQMSSSIFVQPKLEDYQKAIRYQMAFLFDFILNEGTENDLFFIIGDHQPATFPKKDDGMETPVHVISKNQAMIRNFSEYGFSEGLVVQDSSLNIRHEGTFSLLVRELFRNYGLNGQDLPDYLPNGINFPA